MDFATGYEGVNKQGLQYVVLDGKISKRTRVKFLLDDEEVLTTKAYLRIGLPMHPTFGKLLQGQIYKDRKGNEFELLDKAGPASWKIRFLKDGVECTRSNDSIRKGSVTHPTDNRPSLGQRYTTQAGYVTVIKINSAIDVVVQFDDGSITTTTTNQLNKGSVGHPTSGLTVGQEFCTNSGWKFKVIEYTSCHDVQIQFEDGSIESTDASDIIGGSIKPLNQPSVADVGYFGAGRFSSYAKVKGEKAPKEIYNYWTRMLHRCYNPEEIVKNNGRWYVYTEIEKSWFCFQNFAEWALTQPNWNIKHELDKDLLGTGFEYSAQSCTFLPAEVNIFLAEVKNKPVHDLPIGVQYIKPRTVGSKVGYVARCHTAKGREYLGYFDDPLEAHAAYKVAKEAYARVLADKFKDTLTTEAYEKLKTYELSQTYSPQLSSCVDRMLKNRQD